MTDSPEIRKFTMHDNLLRDVIKRQAGTLDKAVLEGVMNLIEAGATEGHVTIKPNRLTIADNGKGFQTRDEVIAAFEMFGKSDERKQIAGKWATFQMGRGQLFSYGKTSYRTRTFEMIVDIDNDGLGYKLRENLPDSPGCIVTVDLYQPLNEFEVRNNVIAIKKNIKYTGEQIYVNGEQVSIEPAKQRWTHVTDDAYINVNNAKTSVDIYNLGVFVETRYLGVGGTVVSRRQLAVNFARNQTLDSCEVWKGVRKFFRDKSEKSLLEKKSFTTDEAAEVIASFRSGIYEQHQVSSLKLFKGANKKRYSAFDISQRGFEQIAFDSKDSAKADKAMRQYDCIVLDKDYLVAILSLDGSTEVQLAAAVQTLVAEISRWGLKKIPTYISLDELYTDLKDDVEYINESKLTRQEQIALYFINSWFTRNKLTRIYNEPTDDRNILIGKSSVSSCWGDGKSYIAFEREYFKQSVSTFTGWTELVLDLCEQYTHVVTEKTTSLDLVRDEVYNDRHFNAVREFMVLAPTIFRQYVSKLVKEGISIKQEAQRDALALDKMEPRVGFADNGESLRFPDEFKNVEPPESDQPSE